MHGILIPGARVAGAWQGVLERRSAKQIVEQSDYVMMIEEIMNAQVDVIDAQKTLREALQIMRQKELSALPVTRNGEYVGILEFDKVMKRVLSLILQPKAEGAIADLLDSKVSDGMNTDAAVVPPEASLAATIDVFLDSQSAVIPVVEEGSGAVCGIVGAHDMIQAARALFDA